MYISNQKAHVTLVNSTLFFFPTLTKASVTHSLDLDFKLLGFIVCWDFKQLGLIVWIQTLNYRES